MEKPVIKRGAWSYEEDKKLAAYVKKYGIWNWNQMPKFAGLSRSGKSCRLRWMNYLRPDVKLGKFTEEEDDTIIRLHEKLGNRWSEMARKLPGRTDNEIKNHWHTRLKKRVLKSKKNIMVNPVKKVDSEEKADFREEEHTHRAEIVSDDRVGSAESKVTEEDPYDVVFWTQPFLIETSSLEYDQPFGYENIQFDDHCFDFLFSFSETEDILSSIEKSGV